MKITIEIDDRLIHEAETFANKAGETLAELIVQALEEHVMGKRRMNSLFIPLTKRGCLMPRVDIDNRVSLYGCMERRN